jgi:hypothetical protein
MAAIRTRLTFANVMSVTAVFIALGGSAIAINKIKANSVGSKQIKAKAVKNSDLAGNAVTSPKVANGSLLSEDFGAGQLPRGATGPAGPQGQQGPTETVDTSNFYDKAASDARFLGIGATAQNSSALGALPAATFPHTVRDDDVVATDGSVKVGFARVSLPSPSLPTTVLNVNGIGAIELECQAGSVAQIKYRNTQSTAEDVVVHRLFDNPIAFYQSTPPGGTAFPAQNGNLSAPRLYQFTVGSGSTTNPPARVAVFDVLQITAPGGIADNTCLIQVQSRSFTS